MSKTNAQATMQSSQKYPIMNQFKQNMIPFLKMLSIYGIIILLMESLFRKSITDGFMWMVHEPLAFLLNLAILAVISGLLLLATRRIAIVTFIVSTLTIVLHVVNIGKFSLRNVPMLYEDFFLIKEVWVLMPELINVKVLLGLGLGILVLFAYAWGLHLFYKKRKLSQHRILALILVLVGSLLLFIGQKQMHSDDDISKTGFLYSLSNNLRTPSIVIDKTQLEAADSLYTRYVEGYNTEFGGELADSVKPNIIIIQSEAYWDVNKMDVKFSKNPNAYFESLRNESQYGEMYVPVVGGGTSNTEYEILTGMTLKNYSNDWYMVYPNEIKSPLISLASILRKQGYSSVGIHPYMSWYYNRYGVYNSMGFNTFKTLEFMNDVRKVGEFAADDYTTDLIINQIENETAPVFNFTVTMQNHGPYGNARFGADQFDVDIKTKMSDSTKYFLHNYVQGLYLSDQALEKLINYLKTCGEPTILLFYGDHLPMLGDDYQAYRELDYIGNEDNYTLQNDLRMMAVPYILWSNYDTKSEELPTMNASFMTSFILNKAALDMPDYLKALYMAREDMPLYFRTFGYDTNGNKLTQESSAFINMKSLYLSIFNTLSKGEGIDQWVIKDNSDFNKTLSEINITKVEASESQTQIYGGPFYEGMAISVNNEKIDFDLKEDGTLQIKRGLKQGDQISIQLLDTDGKVLAELKSYEVQ